MFIQMKSEHNFFKKSGLFYVFLGLFRQLFLYIVQKYILVLVPKEIPTDAE